MTLVSIEGGAGIGWVKDKNSKSKYFYTFTTLTRRSNAEALSNFTFERDSQIFLYILMKPPRCASAP